jgi:hypothetical protein
MMRPRSLIELLRLCRSHAVNLRHTTIQVADIEEGEAQYSTKLVNDIGYEIKDIFPQTGDVLYELLGAPREMTKAFVTDLLSKVSSNIVVREKLLELLLWYGVLGFRRDDGEPSFIYSVGYDMKRLKALIDRRPERDLVFIVNPAFWKGLEIAN